MRSLCAQSYRDRPNYCSPARSIRGNFDRAARRSRKKKKKEHQLATRVWKPSTFHNNTSTRPSQNHATRGCHINRLSAVDRKLGGTRHHKETPGSRGHGVGSGGHRHRQKHKHRHRRRHRIKRPTWTPVKTQPRPLAKGMVN